MKLLAILILAVSLVACAKSYEGYTPAIVVSSIEYDGEVISLGCKGDFRCEQETLECVYHFHKQAQNHIGKVKKLVELGKEDVPIISELYNALCNLYEVDLYLETLRNEDTDEWEILDRVGFTRQVDMVKSILMIKIRQLETRRTGYETSI